MKRGEIWTISSDGPIGKPRPAVILQDDHFYATPSVTLCAFTSDATEAPLFRLAVQPSPGNGLMAPSRLMVDKITTVDRRRLGKQVGRLHESDLARLNRAIIGFLGLA